MTTNKQIDEKKGGFYLNYKDYKTIEKIIEEYNLGDNGYVDFNRMKDDEKNVLWKIKRVILNMESVRLRASGNNEEN